MEMLVSRGKNFSVLVLRSMEIISRTLWKQKTQTRSKGVREDFAACCRPFDATIPMRFKLPIKEGAVELEALSHFAFAESDRISV